MTTITATAAENPRVWVGSLAGYNAGRLVGAWVDLTNKTADEVWDEARELMRPQIAGWMSEAEAFDECTCMDTDNLAGLVDGECSIDEAVAAAELIDSLPSWVPVAALTAYMSDLGIDVEDFSLSEFEDAYQGEYGSPQDYAEQLVDDTGMLDAMPENLRNYFDYAAFTRDLFMDGYTFTDGYVFAY
jgi:antirestriction protein